MCGAGSVPGAKLVGCPGRHPFSLLTRVAEIAPNLASLDLPMLTWLLSFVLLSAAAPCETAVCRCRPMPHEEAAARADVIFTATVVSVDERKGDSGAPRFGHEARMHVHASWKGIDTPEVVAVGGGTSCDFIYRPGDRYLIYGRVDSTGAIHATYCTGSRRTEPRRRERGAARRAAADVVEIRHTRRALIVAARMTTGPDLGRGPAPSSSIQCLHERNDCGCRYCAAPS